MRYVISKSEIFGWGGIILYKIILDCIYTEVISRYYSYADFNNIFSLDKCILSYSFLLIVTPYIVSLYKSQKTVFAYLVIFLTIFSFIPNLTYITFNDLPTEYLPCWLIYWMIFFLACKYLPYFRYNPVSRNSDRTLYVYLLVLSLSVLFISGVYSGFRIQLNLLDVYDIRAESKEYDYPSVFAYLIPAAGTILPIILLYFWEKRKFMITFYIVVVIILNFGIGGHKAIIFSLFVTILFFFFYKDYMIKLITYVMCLFGVVGLVEYHYNHSFLLISLFFRRLLFVPAQLNTYYYDFFINHSPDYFRQSFLRHVGFTSPYSDPIANVIGDTYVAEGCVANNGLFSDAILNFGIPGIIVFPILLVSVLKMLSTFAKGIPNRYVIVPCLMISLPLLSTSLMTALLTSGIIFVMYLFYVFPRTQ